VCKKSIKNYQPFVKKNEKCQDPSEGGDFFDSHCISACCAAVYMVKFMNLERLKITGIFMAEFF